MKLFNFKVDSSLFVVKLLILAAAVPFLWVTDLVAFVCDLKKVKKGAKWFTKGAGIAFLVIASVHICENMLSELSELYVELIRIVWLGFQLTNLSSVSLLISSCVICGVFIVIGLNEKFAKQNVLSLSPTQTEKKTIHLVVIQCCQMVVFLILPCMLKKSYIIK